MSKMQSLRKQQALQKPVAALLFYTERIIYLIYSLFRYRQPNKISAYQFKKDPLTA